MKRARFIEDIGAEIKIEEVDKTNKNNEQKDKEQKNKEQKNEKAKNKE